MSKRGLEHRQGGHVEDTADDKPDTLRRVEILTGVGRRRRFSQDTKARIVLESRAPGAVVSEVARRHGLSPQQLFGWRRKLRDVMSSAAQAPPRAFTPVVVTAERASGTDRMLATSPKGD